MEISNSSNKRLAKNTILMYLRMLLLLVLSLYISRIVLQLLGVSDYGLYSLINGIVISFTFVNTALTSTTQRYLAYFLGKGSQEDYNKAFSICTTLYFISGILFTILLFPIGFWLIDNKLIIPIDRILSAKLLLVAVGISFFISFIKTSYNSVIIAHERITFYAYTGIAEAIIRLFAVYLLAVLPLDKLITFGFLQALIALFFLVVYLVYAKKTLNTNYMFLWDKNLFRELTAFSGWSLYDGMASIGKVEFVNFIINGFFGVVVNAAVGIAKQVNSAVNSFTSNFQTAFGPQITKSYACGDYERLNSLIINTSKFSGAVFFLIAIPLCVNIQYVLELWLGTVPNFTATFVVFMLASSGMEALGGPFWMTSYAIGDIKQFQVITGSLRLMPIPFVYLYLKEGGLVEYVFAALVLSDLLIYIYRISYLHSKIQFSIGYYFPQIIKLFIVVGIVIAVASFSKNMLNHRFLQLFFSSMLSSVSFVTLSYYILFNRHQRQVLFSFIRS